MAILSMLQSAQTPALLLLTIFGPSILPRAIGFVARRGRRQPDAQLVRTPRAPIPLAGKLIVVAYVVWGIVTLVFPPYDIFTSNDLPILVSNESLRRAASRHAATSASPNSLSLAQRAAEESEELEALLTKLLNLDNRLLYARYGHATLATCDWCRSSADYALVSLSEVLKPYILVLLVLAVLSAGVVGGAGAAERKEVWRGRFGWIIGTLLVGEMGARYMWDIQPFEGDCLHLSTIIHTVRSIGLACLPIAYILLPLPTTTTPPVSILLAPLTQAQTMLRLTSVTRAALSRSDHLRSTSHAYASQTAGLIRSARSDPGVTREAEHYGLKVHGMAQEAGNWVRSTWSSIVEIQPEGGQPP